MTTRIGVLTAGGDSPGLNAAIRAIGKSGAETWGMTIIGFRDGFRGLMENRSVPLEGDILSGILIQGGTILGTSRDKPHKMPVGDEIRDMTGAMLENYRGHNLDALICIGGGGTQKNARRLARAGMNIITLPKTIDNDVPETDTSLGFDTALDIATDAVDRLHSTAHSHHRIIVVEIMGHNAGWLGLGAGLAGGADVILIPEIPYDVRTVAAAVRRRQTRGKNFSIVAISEGALSLADSLELSRLRTARKQAKERGDRTAKHAADVNLAAFRKAREAHALRLSRELEALTGLECRVTILGYLQRGGAPSATDRILATRLGVAATEAAHRGLFGRMVAIQGGRTVPVDLDEVVGRCKGVPPDHPWLRAARETGVSLGSPEEGEGGGPAPT